MSETPRGITYKATYEPDMDQMVKALKILHEYQPEEKGDKQEQKQKKTG